MNLTIDKEKIINKARAAIQSIGRGAVYGGVALAIGLGAANIGYMHDSAQAGQNTKNMTSMEKFDYYNDNANHTFVKAVNWLDGGNGIPVKQRYVDFDKLHEAYKSDARASLTELEQAIVERAKFGHLSSEYTEENNLSLENFRKGTAAEFKINKILGDTVLVTEAAGETKRLLTMKDYTQHGIDFYNAEIDASLNQITPGSEVSRLFWEAQQEDYLAHVDTLTDRLNYLHANEKALSRTALTAADGQLTAPQQNELSYDWRTAVYDNNDALSAEGKEKLRALLEKRNSDEVAQGTEGKKAPVREL